MKDKLEELTDVFNMQLKSIKVSEELKLRTLEKCKKNKKTSINKGLLTVTCTIAASLLIGVIIYPIYNRNNLLVDESITLDIKDKDAKVIEQPHVDSTMNKGKINTIKDEKSNDINEKREQQKQNIEIATLTKEADTSKKAKALTEGEKKEKDKSTENKEMVVASTMELIDKEKKINNANKGNQVDIKDNGEEIKDNEVDIKENNIALLSENNNFKRNFNEDIEFKSVSLQEAKEILKDNLKNPSYIPKDFTLENVLISQTDNSPHILWKIIYSNDSQYFKVVKYEDISNVARVIENSSIEAKEVKEIEEDRNIIYMNNIPVSFSINKDSNVENVSDIKLNWKNRGDSYMVEGNILEEELINIVISIINQ